MYMKKLVFLLLPFALMAWGCSGDQITTDDEGTTEDSGVSVDCSTLNTDIAALQILSNEAVAGSTVTDLSGSVITFSSGETATVTVRNAYSFNYANPTISVGSSKWLQRLLVCLVWECVEQDERDSGRQQHTGFRLAHKR